MFGIQSGNKYRLAIISTLSAGKASTYALDNLANNPLVKKIGYFFSEFQESSCGVVKGKFAMPTQLYQFKDVLLVQIRSLPKPRRTSQFIKELKKDLKKLEIYDLILVTSCGPFARPDKVIAKPVQTIYFANGSRSARGIQLGQANDISSVIDSSDENFIDSLSQTGLIRQWLRQEQQLNLTMIATFSKLEQDKEAGQVLANYLLKQILKQ